jgi:hypothetical protein
VYEFYSSSPITGFLLAGYIGTTLYIYIYIYTALLESALNEVPTSGGSSDEATEAVPAQIKLNKKKIKNIILN